MLKEYTLKTNIGSTTNTESEPEPEPEPPYGVEWSGDLTGLHDNRKFPNCWHGNATNYNHQFRWTSFDIEEEKR